MKSFYQIYQYAAFLILFPFSVFVWYRELASWLNTFYVVSMPVLVAYVIPGLGTNVTKLWSFNTRFKIGNFRFYHGFVLGAAMNLMGYMLYRISPQYTGVLDGLFFCLTAGGFIGFINWYYDIYAVKSGFIVLYNRPAYEGKSAHEIVMDYAPVYFFMFGFVYGIYMKTLQAYFAAPYEHFLWVLAGLYGISLVVPTGVYALWSYVRYGDCCIGAYKERNTGESMGEDV